uniref:dTDP-4-dehydrorhamnose reductase n=1 Tax=Schlesneria paludicola TaxID=360056 RepID=A0A7C4LIK8_9PLAN
MPGIAVIGAAGQLGSDLLPLLGRRAIPLTRADVDLTDAPRLHACLDAAAPEQVVNCAAYNFVDRAEAEPERAFAVNALGVRNVAQWCGRHDVPLLHLSTDYVFGLDGPDRGPLTESDPPGPISVYGGSKLAGEWFVRGLCPRHWVVRTCGLYGRHATRGKGNFVETMLRLGRERSELRIVNDQRCTPTFTADLAAALVALLDTRDYGVFHATNAGECSWYEFALEIFRLSGLTPRVVPISSAEYGAAAQRPAYSVLCCRKLQAVTGCVLRPWQEALRDYLTLRQAQPESNTVGP